MSEIKCTFLGNCPCGTCGERKAKLLAAASPPPKQTVEFDQTVVPSAPPESSAAATKAGDDGGYIPMKSNSVCTYLVNCTCATCKTVLNPLDEYIAAFMEKRQLMECTGLVNCVCPKCDESGAQAFKRAEETAERLSMLAGGVQSKLMQFLSKQGPTAKFERKLVEAHSDEMKKTVKRMKKDLELRSKYVFDPETGATDQQAGETPASPGASEQTEASPSATPAGPAQARPSMTEMIQRDEAGNIVPTPGDKVAIDLAVTELVGQMPAMALGRQDSVGVPRPSVAFGGRGRMDSVDFASGQAIGMAGRKDSTASFGDGMAPRRRAGGLFFLLPKRLGRFQFALAGREILWMRNVQPVILKGDKISRPKLDAVTMVICNDVMFLAVHQRHITDSQTYVLVHRPMQRDEVRAEELNPALGGVFIRLFLSRQEYIVQCTSPAEVSYWVRTVNQRRGFKPTAALWQR